MAYMITSDIGNYHAGWDRLYQAYAAFYKVEQTVEMRDQLWGWIEEGKVLCLLALDENGKPVGLAHLRDFIRPLSATLGGFLDDLFIDPSQRGTGLAEEMFAAIGDLGRSRCWSVCRWITREDNYRARAVYDRVASKTSWLTYELIP